MSNTRATLTAIQHHGTGWKRKQVDGNTSRYGPVSLRANETWAGFLRLLCGSDGLQVSVDRLSLDGMVWKFQSPASSPELPITTENGFHAMLRQIKTKHMKPVIIRMHPPRVLPPASRPWNTEPSQTQTSAAVHARTAEPAVAPNLADALRDESPEPLTPIRDKVCD